MKVAKSAAKDLGDKVKAHQRYVASDGKRVPGVTTILGVLNKPALVGWANRLGLDGVDVNKYRDEAAAIGSLAHYLIESELKGEEPDLADYTPAQVERASESLASFHAWREQHELDAIFVEKQLVSDDPRYGGTLDFYGRCDGRLALLDFKTSGAIYPEHKIQVAAYAKLLRIHEYRLQEVRVLQIGRTEGESFSEHVLSRQQLSIGWAIFTHALDIYALQKQLKGSKEAA
jgi:hypothetical protein